MSLFHRHSPAPLPPRITISGPEPADEIRRLCGLIDDLCLVIGILAEKVGPLRRRFADLGGTTAEPADPLHPVASAPGATGDPVVDAARLSAVFDLLQDQADALWFEQQWLAAQIDAARTTLVPGEDTTPAGQ